MSFTYPRYEEVFRLLMLSEHMTDEFIKSLTFFNLTMTDEVSYALYSELVKTNTFRFYGHEMFITRKTEDFDLGKHRMKITMEDGKISEFVLYNDKEELFRI